jgi:glycosyltransferase involved in cell wall biosynthesis
MIKPTVSVIITTKNEVKVIERLLKSLKKQTYPIKEITIIDNNSTDETVLVAKKYTSNIYTGGPERSSQRNLGERKSSGDYLFFLDADMELTPNVIRDCILEGSKNSKIGAVTVPEQSIAQTFWEKVKAYERSFYNSKEGDSTTDAARFFARKAFERVGGYDETITGPEDWDLPERISKMGYKTARVKSLIYHYERIPSLIKLARKKYYYALTSHRYLKRHNISPLSSKTIYFLRPIFYKNPKKIFAHPLLSLGLIFMFSSELFAGGLGYVVGKIKNL